MIEIELLRDEASRKQVINKLARRGVQSADVEKLFELDKTWRKLSTEIDELRAKKNAANDNIANASDDTRDKIIADMKEVAQQEKDLAEKLDTVASKRQELWKSLPNMPLDSVPDGADESENVVLRSWGELPKFTFTPKAHWDIGKENGEIDSEQAATVTGSRFTYLKGKTALLQFALIQYAFSILSDEQRLQGIADKAGLDISPKPFTAVIPPVFIRPEVMDRMGRLEPKEDRYYVESDDLYLIGSAEHTLGPLHMDEIIPEAELPIRYAGYSTSFRREAGSHGKDVRGILRLHQFDKIELESFTTSENSELEQEFIVAIQEYLVQSLGLPYQVMQICTGDMGDPDARQIDINTWMPGQDTYRETHTSDLMTDYQSRRLNTRIQREDGSKEYAHMNDATAFAIGRILIAIIENNQQEDGTVLIPEALHQYLPFTSI